MTDDSGLIKVSFHTFGCKLNFAETASISKILERRGYHTVRDNEKPDICVVNTCSVTAVADKKARQFIRTLSRRYPDAAIAVTGCYAQLKPEEAMALPGVKIVAGTGQKNLLPDYIDRWVASREKIKEITESKDLKEFHPSCERGERTRFFLKVQDGCNYYCTYCTIPYARGHSRSGKIEDLALLARQAAEQGGKEIVITGVNVGEFGKDHGENFFDLIRRLDDIEGIERFRISSIEPNLLNEKIIEWVAKESRTFMPHFHIPLQSGSDKVLGLMKRRYDTSLFASRIEIIREMIPDAFIGVDIIAGARGETSEEWEKSYRFAEMLDVSKYHVFPYSERPGTMALRLDEAVSQEEKHRRVALLTELSDLKTTQFIEKNLDKERRVLWESGAEEGLMQGLTDNYIRVEAPFLPDYLNTISSVRLDRLDNMRGEVAYASHRPSKP